MSLRTRRICCSRGVEPHAGAIRLLPCPSESLSVKFTDDRKEWHQGFLWSYNFFAPLLSSAVSSCRIAPPFSTFSSHRIRSHPTQKSPSH
eukprot:397083-Hanusia_phi.AAC.1